MEDVRGLKELQLDALREVANIGAGHAATALSQMTNRTIMIAVPEVNVRPLEEVTDLVGRPDEVVAAVLMHMMGDLTGRTLVLVPEGSARALCDILFRRSAGTTRRVRRDGAVGPQGGRQHPRERLHERAQRLHGHDAGAVGAQPGRRPERGGAHHRRTSTSATTATSSSASRPRSGWRAPTEPLRGHFLLLPDTPSLRAIFDAIRLT